MRVWWSGGSRRRRRNQGTGGRNNSYGQKWDTGWVEKRKGQAHVDTKRNSDTNLMRENRECSKEGYGICSLNQTVSDDDNIQSVTLHVSVEEAVVTRK